MIKKTLGLLGVSLVLLAGCGEGNSTIDVEEKDAAAMENFQVGDTFRATEPIEFSLLFRDLPENPFNSEWKFLEKLKEITNVSLDVTSVTLADYEQRRSVLIGAGEAPDIMPIIWSGDETPFIASGALLSISEYIQYMPHFMNSIKEWGLEADLDTLRDEFGKFYFLPGLVETARPGFTFAIRSDILEKHNIPIPDTWDEIHDVLAQLKEIYPEMTPWSDRWQMNAALGSASQAFGTTAGWALRTGLLYDEEKGEFFFGPATEEFKEMMTFFSNLVEEGLLDPESFTQDDDAAVQRFVNGDSFFISTTITRLNEYRVAMDEILGKDNYDLYLATIPDGPTGIVGEPYMGGTRLDVGIIFSARVAENENFLAMLQFIDWLYYSEEGQEFALWGIEGETFERDENGQRKFLGDYTIADWGLNEGSIDLQLEEGFSNGAFVLTFGGSDELASSKMNEEAREYYERLHSTRTFSTMQPTIPFTEAERERFTLTISTINDVVRENKIKFMVGQRDISEFDDYVAELEALGLLEALELANQAFKRVSDK